ncbi:hypothetical protein B0H17DRAFT_1205868 [Mycena rosella]|uniref:Uncharacterized protein n=1 Tax=Mycena rosella TaxID=1033263 RepID=A0AAD7D668_MYCRO|nr:hypothetical protein B0H17DRAFT_1205868 [Mycena rosella]
MAVVEDLSRQHATKVGAWSRLLQLATKSAGGKPRSVYQHKLTKVLTIESMLASLVTEEQEKSICAAGSEPTTSVAQWIHNGMEIEHQQVLTITLLNNHRQHSLQETWDAIAKLRDSLNVNLKKFREHQWVIYSCLKLSSLDTDKPELTGIQLPLYHMKHSQRTADGDANSFDSQLQETEIKLWCSEADSGILAVRAASLALSTIRKARELDYRGQAGVTCSQCNVQKAELMKSFEMVIYTKARDSLIHLGHMLKDTTKSYPLLTLRDTRMKETHLHRAKGDSQLFKGWPGICRAGGRYWAQLFLRLCPQMLKHAGRLVKSPCALKGLKDIVPDNVVVDCPLSSEAEDNNLEMSPSKRAKLRLQQAGKKKGKKGDG